MPHLAHELIEDEDTAADEPTVFEILESTYQLYHNMAGDPFFDDLAADGAELINEVNERRALVAKVVEEEEQGLPSLALH